MTIRHYRNNQGQDVEAIEVNEDTVKEAAAWCDGFEVREQNALDHSIKYPGINVPTFLGKKRASQGDFIVRNPRGEFDVKKPGLFHMDHQLS